MLSAAGPVNDAPPGGASEGSTGRLLAVLWVRTGLPGTKSFPVRGPLVRLGQDASCELPLPHPSIAEQHAELRLRGGVWTLADLGSESGSWVDGEPVLGALPLAPGSSVRLGDVTLSFAPRDRWEDSPATAAAEPPRPGTVTPFDEESVEPWWRRWPTVLFVAAIVSLFGLFFLYLKTS